MNINDLNTSYKSLDDSQVLNNDELASITGGACKDGCRKACKAGCKSGCVPGNKEQTITGVMDNNTYPGIGDDYDNIDF